MLRSNKMLKDLVKKYNPTICNFTNLPKLPNQCNCTDKCMGGGPPSTSIYMSIEDEIKQYLNNLNNKEISLLIENTYDCEKNYA